jgi:GNAT superfamily N-acetyltransferase
VDVTAARLSYPGAIVFGMEFTTAPVDPSRWTDLQEVFGGNGGYGGCWCMFWRLTNQRTAGMTADDTRDAMHELLAAGVEPGLLLYAEGTPIGWTSIGPRLEFARLFRTKDLLTDKVVGVAPDDDADDPSIWSIPCVYVVRSHRQGGRSHQLIEAALAYAKGRGATIVESYPLADASGSPASGVSTGTIGMFAKAGFTLHREPTVGRRAVMRRDL